MFILKRRFLEWIASGIALCVLYCLMSARFSLTGKFDFFELPVAMILGYPFMAIFTGYVAYSSISDWLLFHRNKALYVLLPALLFCIEVAIVCSLSLGQVDLMGVSVVCVTFALISVLSGIAVAQRRI